MTAPATAMLYVSDGRDAIGFLIRRGVAGIEAFDRAERSLGLYPTEADAANAIFAANEIPAQSECARCADAARY